MKKIVCYALNAALALSLCACANSDGTISGSDTEGGTPFVEASDPFLETGNGGTGSEDDDGYNYLREADPELFTGDYIDYLKQGNSGMSFDNWQVKANGESYGEDGPVTYRGGEVEISVTATMYTQGREWSNGYLVFVGCTPQTITLNGSEPSTMAVDKGKDGETKEYSIRFTPHLTKENIADKDDLKLTLIKIDNPLYLTFGTVEHFDFEHRMTVASQRPFKLEGDCETTELVSGESFELFPELDPGVRKYLRESLSKLEEDDNVIFELYSTTKEKPVIRDGKADIALLLYGGNQKTAPYKVYFYVNHEPVKVNGCDYIAAELKEGFVAKYSMTVDNLKEGDFVYAIAIAENDWRLDRKEWAMKTDTRRLFAAD